MKLSNYLTNYGSIYRGRKFCIEMQKYTPNKEKCIDNICHYRYNIYLGKMLRNRMLHFTIESKDSQLNTSDIDYFWIHMSGT
jgi:hypothetical protein